MMRAGAAVAAGAVLLVLLAGCSDSDPEAGAPSSPQPDSTSQTAGELPEGCPEPLAEMARDLDQRLRNELLAMFERDQSGRTGGVDDEGDGARTARLKEIIAEHGWPGTDLVGEDGEDAAWTIAQHADLDPDFQRCALVHLAAAVEQGVASPGNLAYLTDRVAVAAGEQQTYGTQIGCTSQGPEPATPLLDPDRVEELRAEAGLEPYADYLEQMSEVCRAP